MSDRGFSTDAAGLLLSVTDARGTTTAARDALGRITRGDGRPGQHPRHRLDGGRAGLVGSTRNATRSPTRTPATAGSRSPRAISTC
ncbi:hypothetical protein ABZZ74_39115 [Streptomyces sp. NPDC006476]|uniref:hypothetical protein n=1 Tax=Streptomyces sp. NPDC006476 TaxID=3157175 RepID=UPI0033A3A21D